MCQLMKSKLKTIPKCFCTATGDQIHLNPFSTLVDSNLPNWLHQDSTCNQKNVVMEISLKAGREPHISTTAIFREIKTGQRSFNQHLAKEPTKNQVLVKQHRKVDLSQNISQVNNRLLGNKLMKARKLYIKDIEHNQRLSQLEYTTIYQGGSGEKEEEEKIPKNIVGDGVAGSSFTGNFLFF